MHETDLAAGRITALRAIAEGPMLQSLYRLPGGDEPTRADIDAARLLAAFVLGMMVEYDIHPDDVA